MKIVVRTRWHTVGASEYDRIGVGVHRTLSLAESRAEISQEVNWFIPLALANFSSQRNATHIPFPFHYYYIGSIVSTRVIHTVKSDE